jgi:hypothetical protein
MEAVNQFADVGVEDRLANERKCDGAGAEHRILEEGGVGAGDALLDLHKARLGVEETLENLGGGLGTPLPLEGRRGLG